MGKLNKKQREEFNRRLNEKVEFFRKMQGRYSCALGTFTPDDPTKDEDFWTPEDEGWWHNGIKASEER